MFDTPSPTFEEESDASFEVTSDFLKKMAFQGVNETFSSYYFDLLSPSIRQQMRNMANFPSPKYTYQMYFYKGEKETMMMLKELDKFTYLIHEMKLIRQSETGIKYNERLTPQEMQYYSSQLKDI